MMSLTGSYCDLLHNSTFGNFIDPPNAKYPSWAFVNNCLNFGYGVLKFVLHVSKPYSSTDLALELKSHTL